MSISDLKHIHIQDIKQPVLKEIDLTKKYKTDGAIFSSGHSDIDLTTFYIGYWNDQWHGGYFEKSWNGWHMYGTSYRDGIQLHNFEKLYAVIEGKKGNDKI